MECTVRAEFWRKLHNWAVTLCSCSARWHPSASLETPFWLSPQKICINVTKLGVTPFYCLKCLSVLHKATRSVTNPGKLPRSPPAKLKKKRIHSGSLKFQNLCTWIISFSGSFRRLPFRRKMSFFGTLIRVPQVLAIKWLCFLSTNPATSQMFLRRQF